MFRGAALSQAQRAPKTEDYPCCLPENVMLNIMFYVADTPLQAEALLVGYNKHQSLKYGKQASLISAPFVTNAEGKKEVVSPESYDAKKRKRESNDDGSGVARKVCKLTS